MGVQQFVAPAISTVVYTRVKELQMVSGCGDHYALLTAGCRCARSAVPNNENYISVSGVRTLYTYACELTTSCVLRWMALLVIFIFHIYIFFIILKKLC